MVKIIIGVVVGLIVVIATFLAMDPNVNTSQNYNGSNVVLVDSTKISVKILGAVVNPGTYTVSSDCYLKDLIEKAGGLVSSADENCFDENVSISGHDSFYIPFVAGFSQECQMSDKEKVNINTASKEELSSINGISTTVAENIIIYRETNGDFICLEDIINVSGIGSKTFEKIRDYICLK